MYEVRNIAFSYSNRKVLRDVSFVVSPGEVVAIAGENGAGKTTLLRILATLEFPEAGTVVYDGQDAFEKPLRYRRQLGYLGETPALYEDMSVREYLEYRAELKGETPKRIRRRLEEASQMCQISGELKLHIRNLSLGMKKRVALADALLLRPRILLLDDFLAGLDCAMRETARAIIANVASFSSVIATGHEIADLAAVATRFLVLSGGTIAAELPAAGSDTQALAQRVEAALKGSRG